MKRPVKIILKILGWLSGGLLLVVLIAFLLGKIYEDRIVDLLKSELKKNLEETITYQTLDFSLIRHFPNASFEFQDFYLGPSVGFQKSGFPQSRADTLIRAGKLVLQFDAVSIFSNEIKFRSIGIIDGKLNVLGTKKQQFNYQLSVFSNANTSDSGNVQIDMNAISLENTELYYDDKSSGVFLHAHIHELALSAVLADQTRISGEGIVWIGLFRIDGVDYLSRRASRCRFDLVDDGKQYLIHDASLEFNGLQLIASGGYNYASETINLKFSGDRLSIQSFLSLVPEDYRKYVEDFESKGLFYFDAEMNGSLAGARKPELVVNFGWDEASIFDRKRDLKFNKTHLKGRFFSGYRNNKYVQTFKAEDVFLQTQAGGLMQASFSLSDLNNPAWQVSAQIENTLDEFESYLSGFEIPHVTGTIQGQINLSGRGDEITGGQAQVGLTKVSVAEGPYRIVVPEAQLQLVSNLLTLEQTTVLVNNQPVKLALKVPDFIPMILGNKRGTINGTLSASRVDLNQIGSKDSNTGNKQGLSSDPGFDLIMAIRVDTLLYDRLRVKNLDVSLQSDVKSLKINNLSCRMANGKLASNMISLRNMAEGEQLTGTLTFTEIDIHELFYSFRDFGQDYLRSEHIDGDLSGTANIRWVIDKKGTFRDESLQAELDLNIINGALYDFDPLTGLSRFIDVDELKEIQFSDLSNRIRINNGRIDIPFMEINSSLLNLGVSGWYGLNGQYDYRLRMILSELLSKKVRQKNRSNAAFNQADDADIPRSELFVHMWGDEQDFRIGYDHEARKEARKSRRTKEGLELKSALHNEFGLFKKDSVVQQQAKEQAQESKKIRVIWDDEPD